MSNVLKKIVFLILVTFLIMGIIFIINNKNSIKKVVEIFIKEDYNFNGGKNNFSTVGSDDFKEYLKARNDLKQVNNDNQTYKVINTKYTFDFKNITKNGNIVNVNLYVSETFSYNLEDKIENNASAGNEYDIYLTKRGDSWKIMSATIKVEEDPVDSYFDVNKELGYSNGKELKGINVKQNLKKMLDKMDYIKKNYKKKNI
ncbi:UNVERIFIED_CONTAM: hypothetical protein C3P01_18965 [Clostridioides difficile]|uniref:hypothetical protein n=1 Tax=Clostridioides difficile TaxID=1496 RepID=UPI0005E8797A|nr:hypothetical protein [Clostridioides difficile]KJF62184.1 hypothetical protein TZ54_16730 [Clostridioides difficile]KJF62189.1 hypothetical protein TZ54_16765 [Clostridioides difficile]MDB3514508.1 hypothetical protein [Clostridioides difficile]MDL5068770.1 hypothetical protein [Clostridioides difficile]MDN4765965.1 hypothetical protein [Clostridioides difficile]